MLCVRREEEEEEEACPAPPLPPPVTEVSLASAQPATLETSVGLRRNYSTHCQINILCSSLSAISVMVGNGVNFSLRKTDFLVGSNKF